MILPTLRTDQRKIALSPARTKVLSMGRRWGKTVLGGAIVGSVLSQHGKVAWIAPTYKNTRPMWRWVQSAVANDARSGALVVSKAEKTIQTRMGGFLGIYSGDSIDSIRGESFHVVVVDEASRIDEDDYQDAIMPTLADYDGEALLISTPKGKNWFYDEWVRGRDGAYPDIQSWQAPTSENPNPNIQKAASKVKGRVSESTYKSEWLAEFVDDGTVFTGVERAASVEGYGYAIPGHVYAIGVDWAKHEDFTVISVVDVTTRELVYMDRFNQIDYAIQVGRVENACERFRPISLVVELNSIGEPIAEQLFRKGLPVIGFTTTNSSKSGIVDALSLALSDEGIRIIDNEVLKSELNSFEMRRLPSGRFSYGAPSGKHDDCVMSLALAWSEVVEPTLQEDTVYHEENVEISVY